MNKYAEIKTILKNQEVVQRYLGLPEKYNSNGNWYKSPFRNEKTASFCVSDKGIHDFGSSEHYDIISFVAKYFNTDNYNALKILCNDFGLSLLNQHESKKTIQQLKIKRQQEQKRKEKIEKWFNSEMQKLCDDIQENAKIIKIFENSSNFEVLSILYAKQIKLEIDFEIMQSTKDKEKLYEGG